MPHAAQKLLERLRFSFMAEEAGNTLLASCCSDPILDQWRKKWVKVSLYKHIHGDFRLSQSLQRESKELLALVNLNLRFC